MLDIDIERTQKKLEDLKGFSAARLNLSLIETVGIFILHYVMNLSEFFGNINYMAGN